MEQIQKQVLGIITRADGTVPFDDDCDPNVRNAILVHLMDQGHTLAPIKDTKHVVIQNWKPAQADELTIEDASAQLDQTFQADLVKE